MQYTRAKRRWQSSLNNWRRGKTPTNPGPWARAYAEIRWIPVDIKALPEVAGPEPEPAEKVQKVEAGEKVVILGEAASKHLEQLARAIEVNLQSLGHSATYDSLDFSRRWAAHVEDRVEAIQLAAAALRQLAEGSAPDTSKVPRT